VRVDPDVDAGQPQETPDEEDRSDQQDDGDGDLDGDEHVARQAGAARAGRPRPPFAQGAGERVP
jgi:hypothetical protein